MTDLDPSGVFFKTVHASTRVAESAFNILSAYPISLSALRALGNIRMVRKRK